MATKHDDEVKPEQGSVLPVMNIMFMLIPALLLAMEVASMAEIQVETPRHAHDLHTNEPTSREPLALEVTVLRDGFRTRYRGHAEIPHGPDIPLTEDGSLDFVALEAKARTLKQSYPDEIEVTLTAENDIELQQIVGTMDALRGTDCKGLGSDGQWPADCLFWQPVVQSM